MNQQKQELDTCGCCEGVKALTPVPVHNQPGLSALAYRVGTHASFKATMQSALSKQSALRDLTTRDDDDPSIALLDAWAMVLDVLSFYQERIANEGYLRTATERRSILEMARSIGYELRPGVAAVTYLAFTLETAQGSPSSAKIGLGTKAQSVPGQDELPQVFETVEEIEARGEWNELKPKLVATLLPAFGDTCIYLEGITTDLKSGDPLVIVGEEREKEVGNEKWEFRRVSKVEVDSKNKRTCIHWDKPLGSRIPRVKPPAAGPKVFALRIRAALFGHNAMDWKTLPVSLRIGEKHPDTGVFIPGEYANRKKSWVDKKFDTDTKSINLDAIYSQVVLNSWIVLSSLDYEAELYRVKEIDEETVADYNITAKTTRLRISGEHIEKYSPRSATVFAQSEMLEIADTPLTKPIFGNKIDLDKLVEGLESGRTLIVSGRYLQSVKVAERTKVVRLLLVSSDKLRQVVLKSSDVLDVIEPPKEDKSKGIITWHLMDKDGFTGFVTAEPDDLILEQEKEKETVVGQSKLELRSDEDRFVSEVVELERTEADGEFTTLVLATTLQNVYLRETVTINVNVARATHGETKTEVIGSGDGSQGMQKFTLKQTPLTYVSASTPSGTDSTLEIRVNDVLWEEVPSLYQLPAEKRAYIARLADDGKVTVQFGDGINGARLPTGVENVKATYRVGTGMNGMVDAEQISLLMTRPLGVKSAVNPLAPTGAADPEQRDQARRNAPLTVLTLDRIVSLQDFEDFARAFAGIGKAQAALLWNGERRMVHLTVAAADGKSVDKTSDLYKNLIAGIDAARHPDQQVLVDSYQSLTFNVVAKVRVDSDFIMEDVLEAVFKELLEAFAFEARDFSQAVTASEVLAVMQRVNGVIAVDLDKLHFSSQAAVLHMRLPAHIARWDQSKIGIKAAELLLVNPEGIALTEMTVWH